MTWQFKVFTFVSSALFVALFIKAFTVQNILAAATMLIVSLLGGLALLLMLRYSGAVDPSRY